MSLWVDSQFVTEADLNAQDPEIATGSDASVDRAENITLTGKTGLINVMTQECVSDLSRASQGWGRSRSGDRGADHFLFLQDSLSSGERAYDRWTIEQIVVTGARPLSDPAIKDWVVSRIMVGFYQRAINKATDDRYMPRYELQRNRLLDRTWPKVMDTGIPIVNSPLYAPGAVDVLDSGAFTDADLSAVAGSGTLDTKLYAVVTWIREGYQSTDDQGVHEGGPSAVASKDVTDTNVLEVSIANLNPPDGSQPNLGIAQPMVPISAATGWNVYVGESEDNLRLQNPDPLPLTQASYTLPGNPLTTTVLLFHGQNPESYIQVRQTRVRA